MVVNSLGFSQSILEMAIRCGYLDNANFAKSKLSETDIPPQTQLSLARLGAEIDLNNVHGLVLDERVMRNMPNAAGAAIIAPDPQVLKTGLDNLWTAAPLTEAIKRPATSACK